MMGDNAVSLDPQYEEPEFVKNFKDYSKVDPTISPEVHIEHQVEPNNADENEKTYWKSLI